VTNDLRTGLQTALGNEYRVIDELGRGGMSRVFLAEETSLGRKVVVKVLPPEMALELSVDRFRREMGMMAQLTHPHIVPILRAGGPAVTAAGGGPPPAGGQGRIASPSTAHSFRVCPKPLRLSGGGRVGQTAQGEMRRAANRE
jgi:hypothetical protein